MVKVRGERSWVKWLVGKLVRYIVNIKGEILNKKLIRSENTQGRKGRRRAVAEAQLCSNIRIRD